MSHQAPKDTTGRIQGGNDFEAYYVREGKVGLHYDGELMGIRRK